MVAYGQNAFWATGDFSLQYREWPLRKLEARLSGGAISSSNNTFMALPSERMRRGGELPAVCAVIDTLSETAPGSDWLF